MGLCMAAGIVGEGLGGVEKEKGGVGGGVGAWRYGGGLLGGAGFLSWKRRGEWRERQRLHVMKRDVGHLFINFF